MLYVTLWRLLCSYRKGATNECGLLRDSNGSSNAFANITWSNSLTTRDMLYAMDRPNAVTALGLLLDYFTHCRCYRHHQALRSFSIIKSVDQYHNQIVSSCRRFNSNRRRTLLLQFLRVQRRWLSSDRIRSARSSFCFLPEAVPAAIVEFVGLNDDVSLSCHSRDFCCPRQSIDADWLKQSKHPFLREGIERRPKATTDHFATSRTPVQCQLYTTLLTMDGWMGGWMNGWMD